MTFLELRLLDDWQVKNGRRNSLPLGVTAGTSVPKSNMGG